MFVSDYQIIVQHNICIAVVRQYILLKENASQSNNGRTYIIARSRDSVSKYILKSQTIVICE